jgi:uncharacterized membrane protein
MFWKTVDIVFLLALILATPVFLFMRWRRARQDRRAFLKKRDQLQGLFGSGGKKSN